ncbi:2-oxoglutarate dehydrogenase E1 component [Thiolapillus sp.]
MSELLKLLRESSPFYDGNAAFIESLYESWLQDPGSVAENWRQQFEKLPKVNGHGGEDFSHQRIQQNFRRMAKEKRSGTASYDDTLAAQAAAKQASVLRLINAYRVRGHQLADVDPLRLHDKPILPELTLGYHNLTKDDLERVFNTGSLFAPERLPLKEILELVQIVYTGTVGSEYMHITDTVEKRWIQQRLETYRTRPELSAGDKRWILRMLTAAEGLEKYLHTRYVGQKRFSLEGGESLIPLLDELIQRAGRDGIEEAVIGMAHRGRLNVLTNIIGKPPADIYDEFQGTRKSHGVMTSGDVKYHKGFSSSIETKGGLIHVVLGFNPSHLEIISPVVEGSVRARQRRRRDSHGDKVLPIVLHGDAAFAGQGVVMETLNMSQARGFSTGGTVHIVINNQIGFTTSDPLDSRSTTYCSDVAKMVQAPIFHVNGDDPEAVIFVTRLALDYRNHFHKDVVIDLVCYRRQGHNEADEPAVTQPVMYQKIRMHPTTRTLYAERLLAEGVVTPEQAEHMIEYYRSELDKGEIVSRPVFCEINNPYRVDWRPFQYTRWDHPTDTCISLDDIQRLYEKLLDFPDGFKLHPRVQRIMEDRQRMMQGEQLSDWGFAENLAYASLVDQNHPVRMSGQDCRRGTFFHRHAMVVDQETGEKYIPLQHINPDKGAFGIVDSLLSEEAVLAFEYGYATAEPNTLTIWEAQFGDFANGAQVVIDQFIASAGSKWGLLCGLTMLLPHGYEGQGPEHSSARIERYMQLCAEQNIQVCIPSTPAQMFHLLRRQAIRPYRRPLVVMTPKSLLRHPMATSPLDAFTQGGFHTVINETDSLDKESITQVIMCSGKIYYELLEARRARGLENVALVRIEQLYPFPRADFDAMVASYPNAWSFVWCQEEPQNQGAWDQIKHRFSRIIRDNKKQVFYVGRKAAAAPATGYYPVHVEEQKKIIDDALSGHFDPEINQRMI